MLVIPLGLGTRLIKAPLVTLALAAIWVLVALWDHSDDVIVQDVYQAAATSGIKDQTRRLFVEYCESRHGKTSRCQRYAVLLWTGFPSKTQELKNKLKKLVDINSDAANSLFSKEAALADKVREEFQDCQESRDCYIYKEILWKFIDRHQSQPAYFKDLASYVAYNKAAEAYSLAVTNICKKNACLVKHNLNFESLMMAQMRHGGMWHLAGNLFMLLIFGVYAEQRSSRWFYLAVLLGGGAFGMAVHTWFFSPAEVMVLGGSANVSAVLGLFFIFFFKHVMRFHVWIPMPPFKGRFFWAPVKYSFPLLFFLSDVSGGLDSGFSELSTESVAHAAHLAGFGFGVAAGLILVLIRPLTGRLIYEAELTALARLRRQADLAATLHQAEVLVSVNCNNVEAMELGVSAFIRWLRRGAHEQRSDLYRRGAYFLLAYLAPACALRLSEGRVRQVHWLLRQVPVSLSFATYLKRLGQKNTLVLADYAVSRGDLLLGIRLYDCFLSRYPLSLKCASIAETVGEALLVLPFNELNHQMLTIFLQHHPESQLKSALSHWLNQPKSA